MLVCMIWWFVPTPGLNGAEVTPRYQASCNILFHGLVYLQITEGVQMVFQLNDMCFEESCLQVRKGDQLTFHLRSSVDVIMESDHEGTWKHQDHNKECENIKLSLYVTQFPCRSKPSWRRSWDPCHGSNFCEVPKNRAAEQRVKCVREGLPLLECDKFTR